jgi:predicted nucleic acid-binding protein
VAWVVDTSVLLDIRLNDPAFGVASAACLARCLADGLVLCPVSYIELAPAFRGDHGLQQAFLQLVGVSWTEPWNWQDTEAAHWLWAAHIAQKRAGITAKRPVADVFIEAFAHRFQGLITRNPRHFATVNVVTP